MGCRTPDVMAGVVEPAVLHDRHTQRKARTRMRPSLTIGPVDRVLLRSGTACGYVLDFEGRAPQRDRLAVRVLRRAAAITSLRLLPPRPGRKRWITRQDPLSEDVHVREWALSREGEMRAATDTLLNQAPSRAAHPPWDVWLLHAPGRESFRIVYRVHHALQDGSGAAHVMLALLSDQATPGPRPHLGGLPTVAGALLAGRSFLTAMRPRRTWPVLREPPAYRTRWVHEDVTESHLRTVARQHEATVNDVCLAGLAGAFRQWYGTLTPPPPPLRDLSVLVPMSFRRDHEQYAVGTRVTAHHLDLPCRIPETAEAIHRVHRQTRAVRTHRVREASRLALALLPVPLGQRMAGVTLGRTAAPVLASSITLPAEFMCLGGRLSAASLVCDLFGGRLCYVSFTRAAGVVRCGIVVDESLPGASVLPALWREAVGAAEQPNEFVVGRLHSVLTRAVSIDHAGRRDGSADRRHRLSRVPCRPHLADHPGRTRDRPGARNPRVPAHTCAGRLEGSR